MLCCFLGVFPVVLVLVILVILVVLAAIGVGVVVVLVVIALVANLESNVSSADTGVNVVSNLSESEWGHAQSGQNCCRNLHLGYLCLFLLLVTFSATSCSFSVCD